jgi:hypothetical protein
MVYRDWRTALAIAAKRRPRRSRRFLRSTVSHSWRGRKPPIETGSPGGASVVNAHYACLVAISTAKHAVSTARPPSAAYPPADPHREFDCVCVAKSSVLFGIGAIREKAQRGCLGAPVARNRCRSPLRTSYCRHLLPVQLVRDGAKLGKAGCPKLANDRGQGHGPRVRSGLVRAPPLCPRLRGWSSFISTKR